MTDFDFQTALGDLYAPARKFRVEADNGPAETREFPARTAAEAARALAAEYALAEMGGADLQHEGGDVYSFESNIMEDDVAERYEFSIRAL